MNINDPNVQQLQIVARALGSLREELVFVGGCAVGLLVTDATRPPARATQDVDLIAEVVSHGAYHALGRRLRSLGFKEDAGEVICRWRLGDIKVDVMPTQERVLHFTNRWYAEAVPSAMKYELPDHTEILLVSAPYFIATKIEAFYGRGKGNFMSHDIEDILTVVDGRAELSKELMDTSSDVQAYLRDEIDGLLANPVFVESLPMHFHPDAISQARVPTVLSRLRGIAGI